MRLKYYLRGLSVGIILTVIIIMIASSGRKNSMSDEEVIKRARQLGMVMQEEKVSGLQNAKEEQENQKKEQTAKDGASQEDQKDSDTSKDTDTAEDSDTSKDTEKKPESDDTGKEQDTGKDSKDAEDASKTDPPQGTGQGDTEEPEYVNIEVAQGEFSDKISQKLFAVGLIDDPTAFNRYLIDSGADGRITVGIHSIPKGASKEEIAGILCEKVQ